MKKNIFIFLFFPTIITAYFFGLFDVLLFNGNEKRVVVHKEIYIPKEFREMDLSDSTSRYSFHRMDTTENFVFFWEKGFGNNLSTAPQLDGKDMSIDIENMKLVAERFYNCFRDTLKFIVSGSNADRYRMMVMINYSNESTAYGGAYDNTIGAIWVTPLRLKDTKFNCVAHEIGHAFQAQIAADGLTSYGGPLWEITSQWMLFQVNPHWMTDENYHWKNYMQLTHISPFSKETMYCNPYILEYWSNKHGLEIISKIWRNNMDESDPVVIYQQQSAIGQGEFNDECFDAQLRFITYDIPRIRDFAKPYRNAHISQLVVNGNEKGCYAILPNSAPQSYGYNGIELVVPQPGTTISLSLMGQMPDSISGEWNYAILPIRNDSVPDYDVALRSTTKNGCGKSIDYTVPETGITHLWMVVGAVPNKHNLEFSSVAFPYKVTIEGSTPKRLNQLCY